MKSISLIATAVLGLALVASCAQEERSNERSIEAFEVQEQPESVNQAESEIPEIGSAEQLSLNYGGVDVKGWGESSSAAISDAGRNFAAAKAAFLKIHGTCYQHKIYATVGLSRPAQSGSRRYRATRTQRFTACSR